MNSQWERNAFAFQQVDVDGSRLRIIDEAELPLRRDGVCNRSEVLIGMGRAHHVVRGRCIDSSEFFVERASVIDDLVRSELAYPLRSLRA